MKSAICQADPGLTLDGSKKKDMMRLPNLYIGRFFAHRQVRKYLACLAGISNTDNFCVVRVQTYARPPADTEERAKMVANIPQVTRHTSWAASERAVAILSEEAASLGWHFHIPMKRTKLEGYLINRQETRPETSHAVDELLAIVDQDEDQDGGLWSDYLQDIGAKGRRQVYLSQAHRPIAHALGVRVQTKTQKEV